MKKAPITYAILSLIFVLAIALYLFYTNNINLSYRWQAIEPQAALAADSIGDNVTATDGGEVSIFASLGGSIRQLAVAEDGWVFAGSRNGKVYAIQDADNDGVAETTRTIADTLNFPHGVAYHNGDLYIGTTPAVFIIDDVLEQLKSSEKPPLRLLIDGFVDSGHHGARHIKVGPDDFLYVALGVPCNICLPPSPEFTGVIRRYPLSGGDGEVYARGIRNAVGFDFHPTTGELWFTDNGRDWLGDELPNDELNKITTAGEHFGYPYCHQGDMPDPEFGNEASCDEFTPPQLLTGPHVANLGMVFDATGDNAYIALHGSWNRSEKIGYSVNRAAIKDGEVVQYTPAVDGWLRPNGDVIGRPVDVAFFNNSLLISDDFTGLIYRVSIQ